MRVIWQIGLNLVLLSNTINSAPLLKLCVVVFIFLQKKNASNKDKAIVLLLSG